MLTFPSNPTQMPLGLEATHRSDLIPAERDFFGPLVGDWDVKSIVYKRDGTKIEWTGVWSFRWILNGAAIEDVLAGKIQDPNKFFNGAIGMRFYVPDTGNWRMVNFEPHGNTIQELSIVRVDGKVVETVLGSNPVETWSFDRITSNSFYWVDRYAEPGGIRVEQEIFGTRIR